MKTAFLILCFQVAIGDFQQVVNPPDAGLECYHCHKYDPNHPEDRCHIHHCHDDEFCEVDMEPDHTVEGKCKHRNEIFQCLLDTEPLCIDYNSLVALGKCRVCCGDANCVNLALNISGVPPVLTLPPTIPGGLPPVVTSPDAGLKCYNCHKYDPNHPEDQCHVHHCHNDEFCQVDIGLDNIVDGKCKHLNEFPHCLTDPQALCNNFNALLYGGCRFCCQDADCVNKALNVSGVPPVLTLPPTIPGTPDCVDLIPNCATTVNVCSSTNAATHCKRFCNLCGGLPPVVTSPDAGLKCYNCHKYDPNHPEDLCHVHHCHNDEFCQVDIGLDNIVDGKCKHLNEFPHCLTDPQALCNNFNALLYGGCRFCCQDADCVNKGLYVSGVSSVVTLQPSTTPSTPNCVDEITDCATTDNVCSRSLGQKVCKKFCNLCGVSSVVTLSPSTTPSTPDCVDLVAECATTNNVCSSTLAHKLFTPTLPICKSTTREDNCPLAPNVCSEKVAPYFCPEFCGLCTRQGKGTTPTDGTSKYSSATTVASTTPSTTNPDNKTMGTTLAATITPISTAKTAVSSTTTTATTSTTTSTPTSTTVTTTKAPPAVDRVPSVSTLPPPTTSGTPDCVDLIPDCATTDNVCSNTFAPIVCKKFCNLCATSLVTFVRSIADFVKKVRNYPNRRNIDCLINHYRPIYNIVDNEIRSKHYVATICSCTTDNHLPNDTLYYTSYTTFYIRNSNFIGYA
ncbi:mucin-2-like [Haliotis rubra]|uniref:mucin-2-like n=1 Tax=Haliotis rubra TaxID=36100 RepID=UPI001EE5003F|nr:mucin-2-like [Haliotis rubra]